MARYVDADKLVERLKASPIFSDFGTDGYFIRDMVIDLVGCQFTADVAPITLELISRATKDYCYSLIDAGKDSVEVTEFNADFQCFLKELYENGKI